jgi:ribosome-associated protein
MEFEIRGEYIDLTQLAQTGGEAAFLIGEGQVKFNGEPEFQKRKKLRIGDVVEVSGQVISMK